ncbi:MULTISPECIES: protein-export chaperone SecB [Levilactobacillus]|uniref:protein-export chaperone SecB n=1 Tax=Levilactobacillus TaxID=2767886 RepID=UPI0019506CB7|nr:protein-export chaperone SecB [Levilactobacillus sp. 244-2]
MTVLKFIGYTVKEMTYKRNESFDINQKSIELVPNLSVNSTNNGENARVILNVRVGSLEDKNYPFEVFCSVEGKFIYNSTEDNNNIGIDTFIRNNCVAILYPYARALVASLTTSSNEFPGFNMPTINVGQMLAKSEDKTEE